MSSSEAHWEPLAEIYLSYPAAATTTTDSTPTVSGTSAKEQKECTYCLCSRVFIRNYYDVYVSTLERGDPLNSSSGVTQVEELPVQGEKEEEVAEVVDEIEDDVFSEEPLRKQLSFGRSVVKWDRCDGTASDASCYFSASASHSDTNYCSTDDQQEGHILHGALMAQHGLHSSDSGADISEKNFEPKVEGGEKEDLFVGMRDALMSDEGAKIASLVHVERNNSLPEVFGREDLQDAWESHWNKHGESIIWASWIEKYSDYINPEYLDHVPQQDTNCNSPHSKSEATPDTTYDASKHFSFDAMEAEMDPKATTEIIVSTCSPHPSSCNDGWNPLNPANGTADDIWTSHRSADNDALLSPRCDSVTSSIPLTIGTTDSMTNVTRMTISSYDFGGSSSKISSESSNLSASSLSEQVSSESESSNSSDMLATECLVGAGAASVNGGTSADDEEAAMDGEQYWQILWQKHFQELYATHYNLFMTERSDEQQTDLRTKLHKRKRNSSSGSGVLYNKSSAVEQLPEMVAQLKLELSSPMKKDTEDVPQDGGEPDTQQSSTNSNTNQQHQQQSGSDHCAEDMSSALEAFGLPTSFGKSPAARKTGRNGGDDDEDPPADRSVNLKRSHESDTEETPNDRLKAAFELMGYAFSDPANRNESADSIINITGEVVYRKKHIRLHNRVLKMKHHKPPRHTYFDEDGNEVQTGAGGGEKDREGEAPEALMHTSSDEDDPAGGVAGLPRSVSSSVRSSAVIEYNQPQDENQDEEVKEQQQESEHMPSEEPVDEACDIQAPVKKEKKKKRKPKFVASLPPEIANDKSLLKYWYKRFSLFSLFDAGIKLDRESWFSVTPEKVAAHTAERCRSDLVVDGFCGCGGNSIQLAFTCNQVIAIDIDPKKIEMAKHNAAVYGVADRIEFIVGDFLALADRLQADAVFLSPPWGGPSYLKDEVYDLEASLIPVPATELMRKARQISPNVALYLPRNSNTQQLTMLAGPNNAVEIEQNFLDRKLIALTAYYGELINE
ncbi:trimethylguanosine synthase [Culex pipiens pallens]|uniref:trimethylguanosine synthase n=1 Tax=Culex pipiens pallens TaxID=42434 RepID=UPI001953E107|nr:trimethylguanosine synthase [Culex pipiens pallens]